MHDIPIKIRTLFADGIRDIYIGQMSQTGFRIVHENNRVTAALIGLLLPAVRHVVQPHSADQMRLRTNLVPGGSLGFLLDSGRVRTIFGPTLLAFNP